MKRFRMPTEIRIEQGSRHQLKDWLSDQQLSKPLVVFDRGLQATAEAVIIELRQSVASVSYFADVEPNPRIQTVEDLAQMARTQACDVVIAIGGGSVMDAAKAAAMLAKNSGGVLDYLGVKHFKGGSLPTVMLPSTCGTGSEVTWVSVLTDEAGQRKVSIKGSQMFPTLALVDADLLKSLPKNLLAWTAMDAMTHAIEATTCNCANPVSDALAEKAIQLMFTYLPRAYRAEVADEAALQQVMRASTLAGMAFGNADVAGVHCLSESLGALYDTPHGLANAVLLVPVLESHQPYVDERLAQLEQAISKDEGASASGFMSRLQQLAEVCKIPDFASLKVPEVDFGKLAKMAVANGSNSSNPRPMNEADYLAILERLHHIS